MLLTPDEYDAVSRRDLLTFAHRCFVHLNLGPEMLHSDHHNMIAAALEDVRTGAFRRVVINLPPRQLKSLFASIAFPAFLLGHNPSAQIICVSYGQALSDKLARDCRTVMQSSWYQRLFNTRLSPRKQSVDEFETTEGGFRLSTSVGGVLTGRGADYIIIDDPQKPDEILSESQRRTTNDWFHNTLYSRLNDKRTGAILIVMQRLHEDDLTGFVQSQEEWQVLSLSAIAEESESFTFPTVLGPVYFWRNAGEALDPRREPLEVLAKIEQSIGSYNFAGQYLQRPVAAEGGMVKRAWFLPYRPGDVPAHAQIVQSWDTASKAGDFNDFSVCTTWAVVGNNAYLKHVHRERHDYPALKRAAREQQRLHKANVVLMEDKGSGIQLAQELLHEGVYAVQRYQPKLSKVERMFSQTAMIENGFVFVPETAPWLDAYLHELSVFPRGKHDDQVDSTSQFLEWLKHREMFSQHAVFGSYGR